MKNMFNCQYVYMCLLVLFVVREILDSCELLCLLEMGVNNQSVEFTAGDAFVLYQVSLYVRVYKAVGVYLVLRSM